MKPKWIDSKNPQIIQRCVAGVSERLADERGSFSPSREDVSRAFAICTAQAQKQGKLKPGTRTLTPYGKGVTSKHYQSQAQDYLRYENAIGSSRKNRGAAGIFEEAVDEANEFLSIGVVSAVAGAFAMNWWLGRRA